MGRAGPTKECLPRPQFSFTVLNCPIVSLSCPGPFVFDLKAVGSSDLGNVAVLSSLVRFGC